MSIKWETKHDEAIIRRVGEMKEKGADMQKAFMAACQTLNEAYDFPCEWNNVRYRYYQLRKENKVPASHYVKPLPKGLDDLDLPALFVEMRRVVKERDELRSKYEEARQNEMDYKVKYEEIKKVLVAIQKESSALFGLLKNGKDSVNE